MEKDMLEDTADMIADLLEVDPEKIQVLRTTSLRDKDGVFLSTGQARRLAVMAAKWKESQT